MKQNMPTPAYAPQQTAYIQPCAGQLSYKSLLVKKNSAHIQYVRISHKDGNAWPSFQKSGRHWRTMMGEKWLKDAEGCQKHLFMYASATFCNNPKAPPSPITTIYNPPRPSTAVPSLQTCLVGKVDCIQLTLKLGNGLHQVVPFFQ